MVLRFVSVCVYLSYESKSQKAFNLRVVYYCTYMCINYMSVVLINVFPTAVDSFTIFEYKTPDLRIRLGLY